MRWSAGWPGWTSARGSNHGTPLPEPTREGERPREPDTAARIRRKSGLAGTLALPGESIWRADVSALGAGRAGFNNNNNKKKESNV